jgi:hypothetical protein
MNKNLRKLLVILVLGMAFSPSMAHANYVQSWEENGKYGPSAAYQTWDKAEAFLLTPGVWEGTGLSNFSAAGWAATLINPRYALATGPAYDSAVRGNFLYTTTASGLTNPYTWDIFLWKGDTIVGVQRSTYTPTLGWGYMDLTATPPAENRAHAPLPPSMLLLGSGLVGLVLLRRRKRSNG